MTLTRSALPGILLAICLAAGCMDQENSDKTIEKDLRNKDLFKLVEADLWDDLVLSGLDPERNLLLERLAEPEQRLDQIEETLQNGYLLLMEDISNGRYEGIDLDTLEQYASSSWEMRNLGFRNWVTSLRGVLLLQRLKELRYQIAIVRLVGVSDQSILINKEQEVEEVTQALREYTKEGKWAE